LRKIARGLLNHLVLFRQLKVHKLTCKN
jgi:hypothetical protein